MKINIIILLLLFFGCEVNKRKTETINKIHMCTQPTDNAWSGRTAGKCRVQTKSHRFNIESPVAVGDKVCIYYNKDNSFNFASKGKCR